MATFGFGYSRSQVIHIATDMATYTGRSQSLTFNWFYGFMKRWPELKVIKPRSLSMTRAKASTAENLRNYFEELLTAFLCL